MIPSSTELPWPAMLTGWLGWCRPPLKGPRGGGAAAHLTPDAGGPFSLCFGFWSPLMTDPRREEVRPCRAGGVPGAGLSWALSTGVSRSTPMGPRKDARGTLAEGRIGDFTCPCAMSAGRGPPADEIMRLH